MKVLALGCCLLALLVLGQAQNTTTVPTTPAPITTADLLTTKITNPDTNATTNVVPTVDATTNVVTTMNNTPNMTTTEGLNNGTTTENNSTSTAEPTTPHGGGPDVKASLLFSVLPLVLYAISL